MKTLNWIAALPAIWAATAQAQVIVTIDYRPPEKLKAMKGIDADHPQIWTSDYGKGRVFSITIGHDEVSLHFQPLQTLLLRGTEWAATGAVTLPVLEEAKDYPTK